MKITVSSPQKYKKSHIVLNIFLQIFLTQFEFCLFFLMTTETSRLQLGEFT